MRNNSVNLIRQLQPHSKYLAVHSLCTSLYHALYSILTANGSRAAWFDTPIRKVKDDFYDTRKNRMMTRLDMQPHSWKQMEKFVGPSTYYTSREADYKWKNDSKLIISSFSRYLWISRQHLIRSSYLMVVPQCLGLS